MKHAILALMTLLLAPLTALRAAEPTAKPNIVLIMADDQGWGDTGYNGHPELKTPNLDELAKSGVSLIPLLDRKTETRSKPIPFWSNAREHDSHAAWLEWPYKLHTNVSGKALKKNKNASADAADRPLLLYDVSKDPKETTDLAAQQPERVAQMTVALEAWKSSVENSLSGADYGPKNNEIAPLKKKAKQL